jgi:hypothetical protein
LVGHRIDTGDIRRFVDENFWEDTRQSMCQQGLAGAGRPDPQDVMPAGGSYFDGTLDVFLALDFAEIGRWEKIWNSQLLDVSHIPLIAGSPPAGLAALTALTIA